MLNRKHLPFFLYIPFLLAILPGICTGFVLFFFTTGFAFTAPPAAQSVVIPVSPIVMEHQSFNACGPYAARAVISILLEKNIPAGTINREMPLRLPNRTTIPTGISMLLLRYGLHTQSHWGYFSTDSKRLNVLRTILEKKHPVILLLKDYGTQHYITIVGYHDRHFSIYDSMVPRLNDTVRQTRDTNGTYPGNRDIHEDELIKKWSEGGSGALFRYWCLEVYYNR